MLNYSSRKKNVFFIIITLLLLLPFKVLGEAYWSQGTEDNKDGAAFIMADSSAKLLWRQELGDWVDRNGELFGTQAFSTLDIQDLDVVRKVALDLTDLVKYWIKTPGSYHGLYLKDGASNGTVVFSSSEAGYLEAPFLAIQTISGIETFEVVKDTYLHASSHTSLGHQKQLKVGPGTPLLIDFNEKFLALNSSEIIKASLYLLTTDRQFGDVQISAFAVAPLTEPSDITHGIAWDYPYDQKLIDHPDVILAEQFNASGRLLSLVEHSDWQKSLSDMSGANTSQLVGADYNKDQFAAFDGHALQIEFNAKKSLGLTGLYRFKKHIGREPEQMYFRYYLRLGHNWRPIEGGKLPGFAGTYNKAGWGGRAIDGYNGWSARGAYFLPASSNSKFHGAVAIGNYAYHLDSRSSYGDSISWNSPLSLLQRNRWYAIEQYLKLNDPGKANGQLTVWIDGRQIFNRANFRFRETRQLKIESLWLNFYHGGTSKPKSTFYLYIDNLVIASQYIGPMRKNKHD